MNVKQNLNHDENNFDKISLVYVSDIHLRYYREQSIAVLNGLLLSAREEHIKKQVFF